MFTILIRALILYILMILAIRAMGKRQMGQFQPYEFAMALLVANLLATPMSDVSTPLLHGLVPIASLLIVHGLIALVCMKSDKARAFISGKPSVIMSKGVVDVKELNRLCLTLSDLLEGIREAGILDPADVECAVMEANGTITAFPHSARRAPTAEEMGIDAGYEGVPMALIMDGRIQKHNLQSTRLSPEWLKSRLSGLHLLPSDVYLATLNTKGELTLQTQRGEILSLNAVDSGKIAW